jgi:oligopeptidase B
MSSVKVESCFLKAVIAITSILLLLAACDRSVRVTPLAAKHPETRMLHGEKLVDYYGYLSDARHPDTLRYVQSERSYLEVQTESWVPLRAELERELNLLLPSSTSSMKVRSGDYEYYREIVSGSQYPIFYRQALDPGSLPELLLDAGSLAAGSSYFSLGGFSTSPDGEYIAYTEDRQGDEVYRLLVMPVGGGGQREVIAPEAAADIVWHPDGRSIYYLDTTRRVLYRRRALCRQCLSGPGKSATHSLSQVAMTEPELVYRESDPSFRLSIRADRSASYLVLRAENHDTTDIRIIGADGLHKSILPRREGHRYRVRIQGDEVVILTNLREPDFELAVVGIAVQDEDRWQFLDLDLAGRPVDFDVLGNELIVQVSEEMRDRLYVTDRSGKKSALIAESGPGESLRLLGKPDSTTGEVFYVRSSLASPDVYLAFNVSGAVNTVLERVQGPTYYDTENYTVEQRWFSARDGERVPITLVYRSGHKEKQRPVYLSTYGAYGFSLPRRFDATRLPLLDRGFVLAFVHVRGGGELGASWHQAGKGEHKLNSVNDLIDAVGFLKAHDLTRDQPVFGRGRSAGGTLVGAAVNRAPALFTGVVAEVPFVDLLNTLLDDTQPLTAVDRTEWGNPVLRDDFQRLKKLSPYEQVNDMHYPAMLITASEMDTRVKPAEALKWIARLREHQQGNSWLFIDIDSNSGHLGATDQYQQRRLRSLEYAFLIKTLEQERQGWNFVSR